MKKEVVSTVSIRYMIDDVPAAVEFYTTHLGFKLQVDAAPAFASVIRDGATFAERHRTFGSSNYARRSRTGP